MIRDYSTDIKIEVGIADNEKLIIPLIPQSDQNITIAIRYFNWGYALYK